MIPRAERWTLNLLTACFVLVPLAFISYGFITEVLPVLTGAP